MLLRCCVTQWVGGGRGAVAPGAAVDRSHMTASPNIVYDYKHKRECDKVL